VVRESRTVESNTPQWIPEPPWLLHTARAHRLSAPDLPGRWPTPAPDSRPALEVQRPTFRLPQRRFRLHSALTPADLPNPSLCFVSAAWASRPAIANYRSLSCSLVARFLSCKQRPSCAIEDTLPNGISGAGPTVNHCSAHGTWGHANDGVPVNGVPFSRFA
jgi:hypothetical protein